MGVAAEAFYFEVLVPGIEASPSAGDGWAGPLEGTSMRLFQASQGQAGQLPRTHPQRIDILRIGRRRASYARGQQVTRDDLPRFSPGIG